MTPNPLHRRIRSCDALTFGPARTSNQYHRNSKLPRSNKLSLRRSTSGIFGNDNINAILLHQRAFTFHVKRRSIRDPRSVRQMLMLDGINTAYDIKMLRSIRVSVDLQSPNRQKYMSWCRAQSNQCIAVPSNLNPPVALLRNPLRAQQRKQRHTSISCSLSNVERHAPCERVRSINHSRNAMLAYPGSKPGTSTESADTMGDWRQHRMLRAPRQRQGRANIGTLRQQPGQCARLRRSTKNEYMHD